MTEQNQGKPPPQPDAPLTEARGEVPLSKRASDNPVPEGYKFVASTEPAGGEAPPSTPPPSAAPAPSVTPDSGGGD